MEVNCRTVSVIKHCLTTKQFAVEVMKTIYRSYIDLLTALYVVECGK